MSWCPACRPTRRSRRFRRVTHERAREPGRPDEGLTKRFPGVTAVDGLTSVMRGEIFGLVGPDGSGKTATMRMLAGVMRPDAGAS